MSVVIIDYGSGNLRSAAKAFERAAAEIGSGAAIKVSEEAHEVEGANRIVLPGVGAFADCKQGLEALPGMWQALNDAVLERGRPFLGICVGMQLMATLGREHGQHRGLAWIAGEVVPIEPSDLPSRGLLRQAKEGGRLKVPHMGWNELEFEAPGHPLLRGIDPGEHAYFVHSYHLVCERPSERLAWVGYDAPITAMVGRDNMVGTQFHPEKSQGTGLKLIANFLAWNP